MTEGHPVHHENPMCIRVWLEVGHTCEPRPMSSLGRNLALDWRVWVRGASGQDISPFVQKVVFYLHPASAFVYPKRVLQAAPYEIQESGSTSIDIPIHIYIKNSEKPKKIKLKYTLHLENCDKMTSDSNCVYYDFENPPDQLKKCLLNGGGEVISNTNVFCGHGKKLLVVITDSDKHTMHSIQGKQYKRHSYKFIEPISWKKEVKRKNPITSTCFGGKSKVPIEIDFKKVLGYDESMTDSEINTVSQLFWSYSSYEKSGDSILLPPMTDPIYEMPELPSSLKSCLSSVESDYAS